jgi:hypothetical protein
MLLDSFRGAYFCKAEAAEFEKCRASPLGGAALPEQCRALSANFLQCHTTAVKSGLGEACSQRRAIAFACLKENLSVSDKSSTSGPCSNALDQFAACGEK